MVIFTEEELGQFKTVQLRRLADYYKVVYNTSTSKSDLIKKLSEVLSQPGSYEKVESDTEPQMSVRVRRIMVSSKEGKDGKQ
ncbi:MAG: hypothetical protein WC243_04330 [Patescibacteria group bacterium]|jgi:hypothetical protein